MSYLTLTQDGISCSHPKAVGAFVSGGAIISASNGQTYKPVRRIMICIKNEGQYDKDLPYGRHDFIDEGDGKALIEAEKFLETL